MPCCLALSGSVCLSRRSCRGPISASGARRAGAGWPIRMAGSGAGLLDSWRPNYPGQPAAMFASYGFLHGGAFHLLVNMITLVSLGPPVIERVGQWRFAVIYAASLLGGAVGFALLSSAVQPMVGASGALFGLAGVLTGWEYTARRLAREDRAGAEGGLAADRAQSGDVLGDGRPPRLGDASGRLPGGMGRGPVAAGPPRDPARPASALAR